jgi:hypothetical protein
MKYILFLPFCAVLFLNACGRGVLAPSYRVELPPIPPVWAEILGPPAWRLVWISPEGIEETLYTEGNQNPSIQVLEEWTTPVIAYPFWRDRGAPPGLMRPAGGLAPFDVTGGSIRLSWRGGADAVLYRELGACGEAARRPYYFNWTRFRELLENGDIPEEVRQDLWSADWEAIARKIAQSGFDRRRIAPMPRGAVSIPVQHEGYWIGESPFAEPIYQEAGTELFLQIRVNGKPATYFSAAGLLRCTQDAWMLIPYSAFSAD